MDTLDGGIQHALRRHTRKQAICEYIWNGFDAEATDVDLGLVQNNLGRISEIKIKDNGTGIPFGSLNEKFAPFFLSDRRRQVDEKRKQSAIQGEDGVGRFTFFHFAEHAKWETVYGDNNGKRYRYSISIREGSLDQFEVTDVTPTEDDTGTSVQFMSIKPLKKENLEKDLLTYVSKQFAWFLELFRARDLRLTIDDKALDYSDLIAECEESSYSIDIDQNKYEFEIRFVRWNEKPTNEASMYYFIRSDYTERYKASTTYNRHTGRFYHSVYVTSDFFSEYDELDFPNVMTRRSEIPMLPEYRVLLQLIDHVDQLLEAKYKLFLQQSVDALIQRYRDDDVFPKHGTSRYDAMREDDLEELVRQLYQVRPRLFSELKSEQEKTFIYLLDLALDENIRDHLFKVLEEVLGLSSSEMEQFANFFRLTTLSNVVKTHRLIEDRFTTVAALKELVFNKQLKAYEKDIQEMIESHYWLFGEEYHLLSAAEPKFEEALRRHRYLLTGENEHVEIDHQDKNREMDIFAVRWSVTGSKIDSIVVELKRPSILLGEKELSQVKRFMRVIRSVNECNDPNMIWRFYLVGNDFDTSGYIEGEIETNRGHGEPSLVYSAEAKRVRIYVKKWSEIFSEFELRHKFLQDKLELDREQLKMEASSGEVDDLKMQVDNTAARPNEPDVPPKPKKR
ncbi:MAG: ATP-binding protein [Chloroflexi bacterium]|nr:ATP-binding protein [Chloroflexota bacterium]